MDCIRIGLWMLVQILIFAFAEESSSPENDVIVISLKQGTKLKGSMMISTEGRDIYAFRGIPYAEPPEGGLRFKPPVQKILMPKQVIDATKDGPVCVQNDLFFQKGVFGQEDCLMLNVYTAELPGHNQNDVNNKAAVMMYIHGGGYMGGDGTSSSYGPEHLLDTGVVLVTINYRLDVFGFLSTGDDVSSGNYGLMDQTLALRWIQDNIEVFGGDPDRVTIFGQSAGGASVGYHLFSPLSKGLFHGAIMMSGSPTASWSIKKDVTYWSQRLAKDVDCPIDDNQKLVQCLRKIPADELAKVPASYMTAYFPMPFTPTVDGYFLPDHPVRLLRSSDNLNYVPVISGINEKEGALMLAVMLAKIQKSATAQDFVTDMISTVISTQYPSTPGVTEMIKEAYFSTVDYNNEEEVERALIDAFSEGFMDSGHYEMISGLSNAGLRTYAYNYEFNASFNFLEAYGVKKEWGVTHFDELAMLFTTPVKVIFSNRDRKMRRTMLRLWSNFAKYGTPVPLKERSSLPKWSRIEDDNIPIYHINDPIELKIFDLANHKNYGLWTEAIRNGEFAINDHRYKEEL